MPRRLYRPSPSKGTRNQEFEALLRALGLGAPCSARPPMIPPLRDCLPSVVLSGET